MTGNDEDFLKKSEEAAEIERKKKELEANRVNVQHEQMVENKTRLSNIKESSFGTISTDRANELVEENEKYFESAKKQLGFINSSFDGRIPFFEKNLIVIGAKTGEGKTTCVANIVRSIITQKHPVTGKTCRCLVITNEESITDFYNRITCLIKGWHYVDHDLFTPDQLKTFSQYIKILSTRVTVIDDQHSSNNKVLTGATTTPEGIDSIFQNLMNDGEFYDVVLLDYYQGINESSKDPTLDEYKSQRKLTHILEKWRKVYPAPIVVMAQIDPPDEEDRVPFQRRVQGTKLICTRATMLLEMIKHTDQLMTEWKIHKGRFARLGQSVKTGYHNGLFVPYTTAFENEVSLRRERAADADFNKTIGIKVEPVGETVNG